jgi:hypothetical protein
MRTLTRILAPLVVLPAMLLPAGGATAAPADVDRFDTFVVDFNTCNGEEINGEGTNRYVSKTQKDGTYIEHYKLHAKGVGSLGNEYVMNWTITYRTSTKKTKISQRIVAISKGSAPNQVLTYRYDSTRGTATITNNCRG